MSVEVQSFVLIFVFCFFFLHDIHPKCSRFNIFFCSIEIEFRLSGRKEHKHKLYLLFHHFWYFTIQFLLQDTKCDIYIYRNIPSQLESAETAGIAPWVEH